MKNQIEKQPKNLQEYFLSNLIHEKTLVWLYLVNGTRLEGYIEAFDQHVIYLNKSISQMVYKNAVASVLPANPYNKWEKPD